MIITTPEGFKILHGANQSKRFMIDSGRLDECIRYIRERGLRSIGINSYIGYRAVDLNFLFDLRDFIEGISIPEDHFDLSVINELHRLVSLGFADNKKSCIDLANFPNLSSLACEYSPRLISLETCEQLRDLTLTNYNSKNEDLSSLPGLTSLKELSLFVTKIRSLMGIEKFPFLEQLSLFRARRLEGLVSLQKVKRTLRTIEIEECKKIASYDVLGDLENLEQLKIGKCKPVANLKFLGNLHKLDFFSFSGTNIEDGDLSPCVGIKYVGFDDKRHYNLKYSDFS